MSDHAKSVRSQPLSPDELRGEVARTYGYRLRRRASIKGSQEAVRANAAFAELAGAVGYSTSELGSLPPDAAVDSFGCGNPTAFAGLREGDVVLDLGSGAGVDLMLAAGAVGPTGRVIGVDMTDEMLARARANVTAAGFTTIEVRKGLIEEIPAERESVDWVISNCVINLSPEKPRVFAEIARVLRPGGQMLVSDIVAEDLPAEVRALPAVQDACLAGAISEAEYVAGLEAAGLTGVEVRGRLVYDAAQIAGFAERAFEGLLADEERRALIRQQVLRLEGSVWSAKIYARKPA